jgi:hypothetical protein
LLWYTVKEGTAASAPVETASEPIRQTAVTVARKKARKDEGIVIRRIQKA